MTAPARARGDRVEAKAIELVHAAGLTIIARNWSCRHGEIDLIARDGETIVFIEVRQRSDVRYGGARESITRAKRSRLVATAQLWLSHCPESPPCRFDVIAADAEGTLAWIRGAFDLSSN